MVTGFAAGYYMGAKAGRQRYEQMNRGLAKLRRSESFETAADRAKALVEDGVEKARAVVESRSGEGQDAIAGNGQHGPTGVSTTDSGLIVPGHPGHPDSPG